MTDWKLVKRTPKKTYMHYSNTLEVIDSALTKARRNHKPAWTSTIDQFDATRRLMDRIENIDRAATVIWNIPNWQKWKSISALSMKLLNMWMMKMEHQTQNWCDLGPYFRTCKRTRNINTTIAWHEWPLLSWCQQLKQHCICWWKVCQASPLYSGPSAEDITIIPRVGKHDVEGLLSQP